jgi:hypothetical protein
MNAKEFAKYVARDGHCVHCGEQEAISPNHRANRGMGGSKKRDRPANIVVLCSIMNGLIESDQRWTVMAREYGWKLSPWDDPLFVPVYDATSGLWYLLDDEFGRERLENIQRAEDRPF